MTLPPLEVTPSAQVLPGSLESLPSSATRVERDTLAGAQYQANLDEALARVPGLVANNRRNYAQDVQLSLRGFGARASFGVRGLRLYTDGIPATMPDGQGQVGHFDLLGAEHVTVLRGPFSALYGASSGGVVELVSREPTAPFAELSAWAGPDELQRGGLAGAWAGAGHSVLATGSWLDTAGYRQHGAATRSIGQARAAFGASRDVVLLANRLALEAQDPLGLTRTQYESDPAQAGTNALAYDTRKTVRQSQGGIAWTPALGARDALRAVAWAGTRTTRQFQSIPDTVQGTLADNPTHPGGVIDLDRSYYGADLRWRHRVDALGVTLGASGEFLDERRQGFQNFVGVPGAGSTKGVPGPQRRDEDNRAQSWDPYAQADWTFAHDWHALLGVRRTQARFRTADRFFAPGNGDDSGVATFAAWLPVAGVRWTPGALSLHLAASRGAETPTLNELAYRPDGSAGLNDSLRAARSENLEAGARWRGEALRGEAVLFRIDTRDEIVVAASSGGRTTFRNAAGTRREGLELSLEWQPLPAFTALASYAAIDARYAADFAGGQTLPGVPRHHAHAELAWHGAGTTHVALEGQYRDAVAVNDGATDSAPSHAVLNLRAGVALGHGLELLGRIDNACDERYAGSVIVNETNGRYFEPAPGRGFAIGLRWTSGTTRTPRGPALISSRP